MIYTVTLRNKKTGQEISRDYDFEKDDNYTEIIEDMREVLENNVEKF